MGEVKTSLTALSEGENGDAVRFTISVKADGSTSLHTEAFGNEVTAYLVIDEAIAALLAERKDMRGCPIHANPPAPEPCPFCGCRQIYPDLNFSGQVWLTCGNRNCNANAPQEIWNQRVWQPHLDYAGESMKVGEFRDPPDGDQVLVPIPSHIAEQVLSMGRAEWSATEPHNDAGHLEHLAESLRMTREHFDFDDIPSSMHGLYLDGTETVLCHTGTSPNSGANAQALAGAWNWLHDQCVAAKALEARRP